MAKSVKLCLIDPELLCVTLLDTEIKKWKEYINKKISLWSSLIFIYIFLHVTRPWISSWYHAGGSNLGTNIKISKTHKIWILGVLFTFVQSNSDYSSYSLCRSTVKNVSHVSHCASCRSRAEEVKNKANDTRQALDLSEEAIDKAQTALAEAHSNLNSTRNATAEVQHGNGLRLCNMMC